MFQDTLQDRLVKQGFVGEEVPLVHNGRVVWESDGWKALISKTDKRSTAGACRTVPLFQTAKKLEITTQ
jgi:hypothetical protein